MSGFSIPRAIAVAIAAFVTLTCHGQDSVTTATDQVQTSAPPEMINAPAADVPTTSPNAAKDQATTTTATAELPVERADKQLSLQELLVLIDKAGVAATTQTLAEGVQVRNIKLGEGKEASTTTTRVIHFNMWLENGKLTRSSRTEMYPLPIKFTPGQEQVIRGIEIGTEGMKVGGKRLVVVPPEVAYGEKGAHDVPPDSIVYYEIEMVNAI